MSFLLMACTDIAGEKVNIELPLHEPPTSIEEFYRLLEDVFRGEEKDLKSRSASPFPGQGARPPEPFTVLRLQRYEDDGEGWADVTSVSQLRAYDQLYVYRKNLTKADISTQRELPPPRLSPHFHDPPTQPERPSHYYANSNNTNGYVEKSATREMAERPPRAASRMGTTPLISAERQRTPNPPSQPIGSPSAFNPREQAAQLFQLGDSAQRGYLTLRDFQNIFRACEIRHQPDVLEEVHRVFAKERRGEPIMSPQNFQEYGADFPQTISVAYARVGGGERRRTIEDERRKCAIVVEALQQKRQALEEELAVVQKQLEREQDKRARLENEAEELRRAADPVLREQEQLLLEKEVSVFRYRQKLQQEEMAYERLAAERRQRGVSMQ